MFGAAGWFGSVSHQVYRPGRFTEGYAGLSRPIVEGPRWINRSFSVTASLQRCGLRALS